MTNRLKILVFLGALSFFVVGLGVLLGGRLGLAIGSALAVTLVFFTYWFSDRLVLKIHRVRPVHPVESMGLYEMVDRLAERAGIPTPKLYLSPDNSPNSFSAGRDRYHASLVVTQGLLGLLSYDELEGVLAHEIARIKSGDIFIRTVSAAYASSLLSAASLSKWGSVFGMDVKTAEKPSVIEVFFMTLLVPVASIIVRFGVSPRREFNADRTAADISGQPEWLASALRKISNMNVGVASLGTPATGHLYIVNPFCNSSVVQLFGRRAGIEERVQRLLAMRFGRYRPSSLPARGEA